jgi:hypothetical protein
VEPPEEDEEELEEDDVEEIEPPVPTPAAAPRATRCTTSVRTTVRCGRRLATTTGVTGTGAVAFGVALACGPSLFWAWATAPAA